MQIEFTSRIQRANINNTGIIYIPKEKRIFFNIGERVQVQLPSNLWFFAKIIKYSRLGIYVPKKMVEDYKLVNTELKIQMKKIEGFYALVASDGRIYLPYEIVEKELLHQNDIVSIKAIENDKVIQEKYVKIHTTTRPKRKRKEFICYIDKIFSGKTLLFQVEKLPPVPRNKKINLLVAKLLQDMHYAFIDNDSVIIFKGNRVPAIVDTNLKYFNLAFYLGAYFADGTKRGNSWAICASTFEQARYYLKMHKFLIKGYKPEFTISYTNIYNIEEDKLKKDLAEIWQKEVGIKVNKFRIRKPAGKLISKWNKYGTLVIREHRQILLNFYNALLRLLIKEIFSKKNKKLAIDFLCGVMEGDGCVPAKKRGHISIATNKNDIHILKNILDVASIKSKIVRDNPNRYNLRIGALEILKNLHFLKDKIFILYPKRKKSLFERLKTVATTKFLIENRQSNNLVKSWLRDSGFCDKNYRITERGLNVSNVILKEIQKAGVK